MYQILLKNKNDPTTIAISDFGLSKFATPHEILLKGCGTRAYAAPEVLTGIYGPGYTSSCDMWSLGIIIHALFVAKLPFFTTDPSRVSLIVEKSKLLKMRCSQIKTPNLFVFSWRK